MSVTAAPVLAASCEIARLWSRRVSAEKRSGRDVGGVVERDQGVGVGGVAGDADADVVGSDLVERLALGGEDRAVGRQQVAALHAGAAGTGADEQGEVDAVEDLLRVGTDLDAGEVRERAVVELHDDALEGLQRGLDLEQAELDGTVAGDGAAGDAEEQAVADLAGGAGDGDLQRRVAHGYSFDGWLGPGNDRDSTAMDASSGRGSRRTRVSVRDDARMSLFARLAAVVAASSLVLAGCGSASEPSPPTGMDELVIPTSVPRPRRFRRRRSTTRGCRWLLAATWEYRSTLFGETAEIIVTVLDETREVEGVTATVVETVRPSGREPYLLKSQRLVRPGRRRERLAARRGGPGEPDLGGGRQRRRGRAGHAGGPTGRRRLRQGVRRRAGRGPRTGAEPRRLRLRAVRRPHRPPRDRGHHPAVARRGGAEVLRAGHRTRAASRPSPEATSSCSSSPSARADQAPGQASGGRTWVMSPAGGAQPPGWSACGAGGCCWAGIHCWVAGSHCQPSWMIGCSAGAGAA